MHDFKSLNNTIDRITNNQKNAAIAANTTQKNAAVQPLQTQTHLHKQTYTQMRSLHESTREFSPTYFSLACFQ